MNTADYTRVRGLVDAFIADDAIAQHPLVAPWKVWGPVIFSLQVWDGGARLAWLQVLEDYARQGWAGRFLNRLTTWADANQLVLTLDVCPRGAPKLSKAQLRALYGRHGFVVSGSESMDRKPRKPKAGGPC